jgi:transposase-like protein
LKGEQGRVDIEVPRDRQSTFEPQLVRNGQSRLEGFDEKILALYARGMTTRDIQAQLQELYGVEVSPTLISNVTEAVMDEVRQWQSRPLEPVYPIIYVDCLAVHVRENQRVINKSLYLVLAVDLNGQKELLGMWIAQAVATDLKAVYSAATEIEAKFNLELKALEVGCVLSHYQQVVASSTSHVRSLCSLFRRTSAESSTRPTPLPSVNMTLRKVTRNHRIFPSDEAVYKVVYLAMRNIAKKWTMPIHNWKPALNRLTVECAERFPH